MRVKIQFSHQLVDLVIWNYSNFQVDGLGISVSFKGVEEETQVEFDAKIKFHLVSHKWVLMGKISGRPFNRECNNVSELFRTIKDLVSPYNNQQKI